MSLMRNLSTVSDRKLFGLTFFIGFAVCTLGIGKAPVYGWMHPISILGYILGAMALFLGVMVLFRIRIPPIRSDRAALVALLGIIAVKFILSALYPLS